jgi:prophage regulatory protein
VALTPNNYQHPSVNAAASTHPSGTAQPPRLITKAELCRIVPYTPQHILRLEKRGLFPRRVQVGPNRVAWLLSEIEQWVEARIAERDCSLR